MAITTTAAILGGAAIAGSVYGASKASKASKYAADQSAEASRLSDATNRYIYDTTRADNETRRVVGDTALTALAGGFGLPVPRAGGMMTAPAGGSRPSVIGAQGFGGYGSTDAALGPTAKAAYVPGAVGDARRAADGVGGGVPTPGATMLGHNGGPAMDAPAYGGQPDYAAYGAANPDVAAEWDRIVQTGNADAFGNDPNAYFASHYAKHGQPEGRDLPTTGGYPQGPQTLPADGGYEPNPDGSAPGYSDPTSPGGYMIGARPDMGAGPGAYQAAQRAEETPLRVSYEDYQNSPEFRFRMSESQKELDRLSSATGGRFAGRRIMAGVQRAQDVASTGYTDYRNYTTGQHNLNRARGDAIYSEDRGFGYGQARDARGDFVQDRGRSDGLHADDRAFTTGRYDTRNQMLLNMAGFGSQASASNAAAGQSWAQQTGQNAMTTANARGNAAINSANAWNQGFGNLMTTGAYLAGSGAFGGGGGASFPKQYSI